MYFLNGRKFLIKRRSSTIKGENFIVGVETPRPQKENGLIRANGGDLNSIYRNEIQVIKANRKVIPIHRPLKDNRLVVGARGDFSFNLLSGVTLSNKIDKLIWGISEEEIYNFDTALKCIHPDYRQLFTDKSIGSIGKVSYVEFKILLKNGIWTKERYNIMGGDGDYEITSNPVFINGTTTAEKLPQAV